MNLSGKMFILIGLLIVIGNGYLVVEHDALEGSYFGIVMTIIAALVGLTFTAIGCNKYMNGQ